ncbi:MAG: M24 family metallopeptidase [Xanthomonadales bacterium]|nr:M24 family metallopeptidase [Xanthomonadales bacterium]
METTTPDILVNLPRAAELMARRGVDGLVARLPYNVYYLSGYWGLLMNAAHFDAAFFAVLPARPDQPAALVMPSMELRRLVTQGGTWMPETFIYSSPEDEQDQISIDGKPYGGWPVRQDAELTRLEQRWIEATREQAGRVAGNARGALVRAVRGAGLEGGQLVSDDARIGPWLDSAGVRADCHTDPELFNHIRLVKTPAELHLMRTAARINEESAREAAAAFREGAHWAEIESVYFAAMARRGGRGSYLMCGAGGPPAGVIRQSEPMFIDALGTWQQYHGDFGRCVVVGEPSDLMRQRHAALVAGWEAAQPLLKPGVQFSEVAEAAVHAVRRSGLPEFVYATPHAVGLEHSEDPRPPGSQQGLRQDLQLEAGMVLNIDMPFTEIGWGSVHIEDTVHITPDGFETLTSADLDIICV